MMPRRGAEVAQINEKGLKDVLEVRKALDTLCAELACERITDSEKNDLRAACGAFERATISGNITDIAARDVALHDIIVKSTGNERLIQLVNNLSEQMYRYRFEYIKDESRHDRLVQEHKAIYDAIMAGDKDKASKAAAIHIDNQEKSILGQIRMENKQAEEIRYGDRR